ncbi:hypothetical protein DPEC_G00066150 [Dallia pectoralis]|uniref:Uncharacterized protein n=1 Tax=Dallia pectoralis TaxID=75939 RepID=A0ACC2H8W1_DALPE|nr:hypothetical protein DPEC_G00066150 [Dallia pectoralis]
MLSLLSANSLCGIGHRRYRGYSHAKFPAAQHAVPRGVPLGRVSIYSLVYRDVLLIGWGGTCQRQGMLIGWGGIGGVATREDAPERPGAESSSAGPASLISYHDVVILHDDQSP